MSVVYGNTAVSNPGTVANRTGRDVEHMFDRHLALERHDRLADRLPSLTVSKHHFGVGRRRHDVRRDAAGNEADGVVGVRRGPDRRAA